MMKIKFNGGPRHNERDFWDNFATIRIMSPPKFDYVQAFREDVESIMVPQGRIGEYHKSHRKLKDGTIVFQWMGYLDGKA